MLATATATADSIIFGPWTLNGTGRAVLGRKTFRVRDAAGTYVLRVRNRGVLDAFVAINGRMVLRPSDFRVRVEDARFDGTREGQSGSHDDRDDDRREAERDGQGRDDRREPERDGQGRDDRWEPERDRQGRDDREGKDDHDEHGQGTTAVPLLMRTITLRPGTNEVVVGLRSARGTSLSVEILRKDTTGGDATPPTISASASPAPNGAGWNRTDVTVSFACMDNVAVQKCPAPVTVTTEGAAQVVTGTATDTSGNTATASATLNIDKTAPAVQFTSPADNSTTEISVLSVRGSVPVGASPVTTGVCNGVPATLDVPARTFACDVPLAPGANAIVAAVTDAADNVGSATLHVIYQPPAPTISGTVSPAPNAAGWNRTDVTVTFTCTNATTCPAPVSVTTEGAHQIVTGAAVGPGGMATTQVTVNVDTTPPDVTAVAAPETSTGWNNGPVTVTFAATDALSGVAPGSLTPPVTLTMDGANQSVSGQATDVAGNVRVAVHPGINIDQVAPRITVSLSPDPVGGYLNTALTATFTCSDTLSGIASCPPPQVVDTEGTNLHVIGTATDAAGNSASVTSAAFSLDLVAPSIIATVTPAPNAAGWHRIPASVHFTCADGGSGVAVCPPDQTVDTDGANQVVEGTATDRAGNSRSASAKVNVDRTPPVVSVTAPADGTVVSVPAVSISGSVGDATSGVSTVTCNGVPATVSPTAFDCSVPLIPKANTIIVEVGDIAGNTATTTMSVTYAAPPPPPTNHDPAITSTSVATALEGKPYVYDVEATDSDAGDVLTFALLQAPVGMTIDGATGLIAWTPASADVPSASVTVRVIDDHGGSATQSFTVAVSANRAPVIGSTPVVTGTEATPYRYDVAASDADGDPLVYTLLQAPAGMTMSASGRIDWTPGSAQVTTHAVTVEVRDDRGGRAIQSFSVTVAALNRAPHIDSSPVTTAREGLLYSYQVHATDPNGDAITYALTAAPPGMTIDPAGGLITWTPPPQPPASVDVAVSASDAGGASDTQTFALAVAAAPRTNHAPRLTSTPDITAQAAEPYVYEAHADDPDVGDVLTFSLVQKPVGMTIDAASGLITWTPSAAQIGPFSVIVRVSDGTDAVEQAYELTVVGQQTANRPPSAHTGGPYHGEAGVAIVFSGTASTDPDGDTLTFAWNFGDGSAPGTGESPSHIYQEAGSFVVTLTVSDGHGGESARSTSVAIGAAGDRSPPTVTLNGPREVLPGDQVTISAQAVDNVRIEKVVFQIDGGEPTETSTPPFQQALVVPSVASPGTTIEVKATAFDPSGNSGSAVETLTIKARPDTEKPTVRLNAPPLAAPGTTIRVSASAADNAGVQSVGFTVNGAALITLTEPPYEAAYEIPAGTPVGAALTIGAFALDFSANRNDVSAVVAIIQTPDTQPPTVQLSAASTIVPGVPLAISAAAADNRGVAFVDFYVDGVPIANAAQAPYAAVFNVPAGTPPGRALQIEARATDFAGLQGTDSRQTLVVQTSSLAQGTLAGEVYDDATGLPVEGAAVALAGADVSGQPYTQTATTDARGRYLLRAVEGSGVLHITRQGWTAVDRRVDVVGNKSLEVFDARLTPLAAGAMAVEPVIGATIAVAQSRITLTIPPGGLDAPAALAVTAISGQGLQGLLPAGWSVLGGADVTPHTVAFAAPATLTLAAFGAVAPGTPLVLARYHEPSGEWRAAVVRGATTGPVAAAIADAGQYVWLKADVEPAAPPSPMPGAPIQGVVVGDFPLDASAIVAPESKVVLYQPGVKSEVTGLVTPGAPVPSGTPVLARIAESYEFQSGLGAHPDAYVEDLVLYQAPNGSTTLSARHTVTPSIAFEAASLKSGTITIELLAPATSGPRLFDTIAANGGTVTAPTGERADVPPNGLATPAAVIVQGLTADDLDFALPPAVTFAGGLQLSSSGATFALPITLSVPKPAQVPADAQILVVHIVEVGNASRLALAAIGRVNGDRIESMTELAGDPDALEGVRTGGRYLFLRPVSAVGFATGLVRGVNGDPFAGALVSADTLPIVALSRGTGRYTAGASLGPVGLLAQDVTRNDSGGAQAMIAAAGVSPVDLRLGAQAPAVLSITPADQTSNVPLSNPVVVTFSEPLNPASITPSSVVLAGPDGVPVAGTLSLSGNNAVVTFRPSSALPAETAFTVTVAATIADLSGYTLAQAVTSHFTSFDVTAPPPPAAGTLAATMPGTDGNSTVTGTQGTANPRDTVSILNVTRGTSTPVLIDPNGGFSTIVPASLTDQLKLKIVDVAGNTTVVALPRFSRTNADGSVSVAIDAEGGKVDGPGGVSATVKPGTFPDGAVVTIKPVSAAQYPVTLKGEQKDHFAYAGGVQLDFGGKVPTQYVNVAVPAGPNDKPGEQWVVSFVKTLNGEPIAQLVDTAKLIDGQVTTSSPPCPGVNAAGVYGFHKSDRPVGVTYGTIVTGQNLVVVEVFGSPWVLSAENDEEPMCFPVLSGRITIVPNTVSIAVPRTPLTRQVDRIVVTNHSRGGVQSPFRRESMEVLLNVPGSVSDTFDVTGVYSPGSTETLKFVVRPAAAGTVDLALGIDMILKFPSEYVVKNLTTGAPEKHFAGDAATMLFTVAGGASDSYSVSVFDAFGASTPATFSVVASSAGAGNLVARALPGTIDPTQAEVDAYNAAHPDKPLVKPGRKKVEILTKTAPILIPDAAIVGGGFAFAFAGDPKDPYVVQVTYLDDTTDSIQIPVFSLTLKNVSTGAVVKTIVLPSPPADQPLNLGKLTGDHDPPNFTSDLFRFSNFDPSDVVAFSFDEAMDAQSLKDNLIIRDSKGNRVLGELRVSDGNKAATFVPAQSLAFGETYTISFAGVTDRGGNGLAVASLALTTVAPHVVGSYKPAPAPGVRDLQLRPVSAGGPTGMLVVTTNTKLGNSFFTVDVNDPAKPTLVGSAVAGFHKRQLELVPGVSGLNLAGASPCGAKKNVFSGDLAITSSFTIDFTYMSFFDYTDPATPCLMSNKILTATPDLDLFEAVQGGTYHVFGVLARGVATIRHSTGLLAYTAIAEAGVFSVDVGANVPEKHPRFKEPMLPGNYYDVAGYAGRLVALNRDSRQLEVIDPSLAILSVLPLPDAPRRIVVSEKFPFDANGNGTLEPGESVDAVFIGGDKSVVMADVTNLQAPRLLGMIPMPTWINALDVDRLHRRAVVADIQSALSIVDLGTITGKSADANADGVDDRVIWRKVLPDEPEAVRIDPTRPYIYVGNERGVDIYTISAPLSGIATYTSVPATAKGLEYAKATPKPIRGALVELRDPTGTVLAVTTTDATGYYSFDVANGSQVEVLVRAELGGPGKINLRVVDNFAADPIGAHPSTGLQVTSPDRTWAISSGIFTTSSNTRKDIYAETVWQDGSPRGTYTKRAGAPFAILDLAYQAETMILKAEPKAVFPLLLMAWSPKNQPSGNNIAAGLIGTSKYSSSAGTLYILGAENVDTDEYDSQVVLHEWSHYFEDKFSRSDSIGDDHSTGDLMDPRVAFGEGFATAHASMLTGNKLYADTSGDNQKSASPTDLEKDNCPGQPLEPCAGVFSGFFSEDAVMELLWDLFDPKSDAPENDADNPGSPIQDDVVLGYKPIFDAMVGGEKKTRALTSIFSFMTAVTAPYLADPKTKDVADKIYALAKAEGIDLTKADEYELSTQQLYTVLPVDGTTVSNFGPGPFAGTTLSTNTVNDPNLVGNKLYSHVFFKFTVAAKGTYDVVATPTNNKALWVTISDGGKQTSNANTNLNKTATATATLEPGDYVVYVSAQDYTGTPPAWTKTTNATFTISITKKP